MAAESTHRWRPWLALFGAPVLLAVMFVPVVGFLWRKGLRGADLEAAVVPLAPYPASLGFILIFFSTLRLARKDDLSARALGWTSPTLLHVGLGAIAGVAVATLDELWLHPLIRGHQPTFDPTLANTGLIAATLMLTLGTVAEETLFRGYAFVSLSGRYGTLPAIVITSAFYALLAPGFELPLKLWAFGFGVVLAMLRAHTGRIAPGLIAHVLAALTPKLLSSV